MDKSLWSAFLSWMFSSKRLNKFRQCSTYYHSVSNHSKLWQCWTNGGYDHCLEFQLSHHPCSPLITSLVTCSHLHPVAKCPTASQKSRGKLAWKAASCWDESPPHPGTFPRPSALVSHRPLVYHCPPSLIHMAALAHLFTSLGHPTWPTWNLYAHLCVHSHACVSLLAHPHPHTPFPTLFCIHTHPLAPSLTWLQPFTCLWAWIFIFLPAFTQTLIVGNQKDVASANNCGIQLVTAVRTARAAVAKWCSHTVCLHCLAMEILVPFAIISQALPALIIGALIWISSLNK